MRKNVSFILIPNLHAKSAYTKKYKYNVSLTIQSLIVGIKVVIIIIL